MSLAARRAALTDVNDTPTILSLRNFRTTLQGVTSRAERCGDASPAVWGGIVILTQVLVNAALNNSWDQSGHELACQAASSALSIVASFERSAQRTGPLGNKERASLLLYLQSVEEWALASVTSPSSDTAYRCCCSLPRLLTKAIKLFTHGPRTKSALKALFGISEVDAEISRVSAALRRAFAALSFKLAILEDHRNLLTRISAGGADSEGLTLTWRQVKLLAPSRTPETTLLDAGDYWENTFEGTVDKRRVVIKTYPGESFEAFSRDLDIMRSARHSNLPLLFGYSKKGSSTPFLAMSMESYTPLFQHLALRCSISPKSAVDETWELMLTCRSTAEYLLKQGMLDNIAGVIEVTEMAVVDNTGKLILAPRPQPTGRGSLFRPPDEEEAANVWEWLSASFGITMASVLGGNDFDALPRALWPVRNRLRGSDEVFLPSSAMRIKDQVAELSSAKHWRTFTPESRVITCVLPSHDNVHQPVVGDLGRFARSPSGRLLFIPFTNVQSAIGGYILNLNHRDHHDSPSGLFNRCKPVRRLSHTTLQFYQRPFRRSNVEWATDIPEELALMFLTANAQHYSELFGIPPEDLVLITKGVMYLVTVDPNNLSGIASWTIVHLDEWGRVLRFLQSDHPNPVISSKSAKSASTTQAWLPLITESPPEWRFEAGFVQLEEHELDEAGQITSSEPRPRPTLGDVGCFGEGKDGQRIFLVLCSVAPDLRGFSLEPWERNECEDIGGGVWRSPPIDSPDEALYCFSWMSRVGDQLDLPDDLVPFYLYSLSSDHGRKTLPCASNALQMVLGTHHQIQAKFTPQSDNTPLRLFVHFDVQGAPQLAYWSSSKRPRPSGSLGDVSQRPGCTATIFVNVLSLPAFHQVTGRTKTVHQRIADYSLAKARTPGHSSLRSPSIMVGDVGYWEYPEEQQHRRWRKLGRIISSTRKIAPLDVAGDCLRVQIPDDVWSIFILWSPNHPTDVVVHSRWNEELHHICPRCLLKLSSELALQNGVPQGDIHIVSQAVVSLHGSASPEALREINPRRYTRYLERKERERENKSAQRHSDSEVAGGGQSGDRTNTEQSNAESSENELYDDDYHDLQLYAVLPPTGGCYGVWSSETVSRFNYRALSVLDLEGWQLPGCHARTSVEVGERTTIAELCKLSEALGHDATMHRVGEGRWEFGNAECPCS